MSYAAQQFPLWNGVNEYARETGPCVGENWEGVLAHAHHHEGVICVPSHGRSALFQSNGQPTSLFLHEYAHLMVPGGHSDAFWATCKQLHADYQVTHDRFARALFAFAIGALLLVGSIVLAVTTGVIFFAIGAVIVALGAIPVLIDSFGTEQAETLERECGTRG